MDESASLNTSPIRSATGSLSAGLNDRRLPLIGEGDVASDEVIAISPSKSTGASVGAALFVLLNTILGSGILGLPGAYAKSGYIGGTCLLFITAALAIIGAHLLVEAADKSGRPASFFSVAEVAGGKPAGVLIDVLIAINAYGAATSYLIVVSDVLPNVADSFGATGLLVSQAVVMGDRRVGEVVWMLFALLIGAPLAFLRNISALRFSAYFAFVMIVYLTVLVGVYAVAPATFEPCQNDTYTPPADAPKPCEGDFLPFTSAMTTLSSLPLYIFAFSCHQNALSTTNEMAHPTQANVLKAVIGAISLGVALYFVVGFGGYSTFGSNVDPDVLKSYPEKETMPQIGRIAIALTVIMCYPMQVHPGRGSLISLAVKSRCVPQSAAESTWLLVLSTSVFIVASVATAIPIKDLGLMLSLIGTVCSTSVQFILPGASYFVLYPHAGWKRYLSLAQLVLGLVIVPLCLTLTFIEAAKG